MDTEKFDGFPHPDHPSYPTCTGNMHPNMHLLEMEGKVTWWLQLPSQFHVWSFDIDEYVRSGGWNWTPLYTLPYRSDFQKYPCFGSIDGKINLVTIRNKQVLLVWPYRGVFWYNLETNAVTRVRLKGKKMNKLRFLELDMIDYKKTVVTLKQNMIRAVV
ncbi:F-box family protein [Corchorus olitorius]|uniref:F-box family protein n=1 Tax=Corchorus olitorius TaxID=93759 RepID=A0A1R3JWD4_9ROSI|nr:F-box family protein [Corchorus olitorius]